MALPRPFRIAWPTPSWAPFGTRRSARLNQVIHVWPYDDLRHRQEARAAAAKDPNWPPKHDATLLNMESEICIGAPFMRDLGEEQELGSIYEMRTYTYRPGSMPTVIERWAERIGRLEALVGPDVSPAVECADIRVPAGGQR